MLASPYPLLRLMWRPAVALLLFPIFWALAWPFIALAEEYPGLVGSLLRGESSAVLQVTVVQLAIHASAAISLAFTLPRIELQHTVGAWTLPRLREALRSGHLVAGAALAVVAGAIASRAGGAELVVVVAAASFVSFSLWAVAVDSMAPAGARILVVAATAVAIFRPEAVSAALLSYPVGTVLLSLAAATAATAWSFSSGVARERPFRYAGALGASSPLALADYWSRAGRRRSWSLDLSSDRVTAWLRAAEYEMTGRTRFGYLGDRALQALLVALFPVLLDVSMVVFLGIVLGVPALQLRRSIHRPLSRERRAALAHAGATLDLAVLVALAAIFYPLVWGTAAAIRPMPDQGGEWLVMLGLVAAWGPVAQWSAARGTAFMSARSFDWRTMLRQLGGFTIFVVAVSVSNIALTRRFPLEPGAVAAVILLLIAATQLIQWLSLRRYFRTADLGAAG